MFSTIQYILFLAAIFLLETKAKNETQIPSLVEDAYKKFESQRLGYDFAKFEDDGSNHESTVVTSKSTVPYEEHKFEDDDHQPNVATSQISTSNQGLKYEDVGNNYHSEVESVQTPESNPAESDGSNLTSNAAMLQNYEFKFEDSGKNSKSNIESFQSSEPYGVENGVTIPASNVVTFLSSDLTQKDKIENDVSNTVSNFVSFLNAGTNRKYKVENDDIASSSNGGTLQISNMNQGYKIEENATPNTNSRRSPQNLANFNLNHFSAKQLVFSNHKRFSDQDQVKFQDENSILDNTILPNNFMSENKNQVIFQDQNSIDGNAINFPDADNSNSQIMNYESNILDNGLRNEDVPVFYDNHYPIPNNNKKKKPFRRPRYHLIRYPVVNKLAPNLPQPLFEQQYGNPNNKILIPTPQDISGHYSGQFNPLKPSFPASVATDALATLTSALANIAMYDDHQCVAYLLCDAASGGSVSSLRSSQTIQMVAKLQPILHLLAAYNGLASSPMYLFGRAVFLGATSKSNPDACHQAYPQCPTDPEKLVNYLNNHNGGLFRFLNAPSQSYPPNVPNLEEYSIPLQTLASQQNYVPSQQNYGFAQPLHLPYSPQYGYGYQMPHGFGFQQNSGFLPTASPLPKPPLPTPFPQYYSPMAPPNAHLYSQFPHFHSAPYSPSSQYYASQYPTMYGQYGLPANYYNPQQNMYPYQYGPNMAMKFGYQTPYTNGLQTFLMKPF